MDILLIAGIILLILAVVAYIMGARGLAGMTADLGKWLILAFIVVAVILFVVRAID